MGCTLAQDRGRTMYTLIGKTGRVKHVGQHSKWRTSITFGLIALCIPPFELVMPVFSSMLVQYQTFLLSVKQTLVAVLLGVRFSLRSSILTR